MRIPTNSPLHSSRSQAAPQCSEVTRYFTKIQLILDQYNQAKIAGKNGAEENREIKLPQEDSDLFKNTQKIVAKNIYSNQYYKKNLLDDLLKIPSENKLSPLKESCSQGDYLMVKELLEDRELREEALSSSSPDSLILLATASSNPNQKLLRLLIIYSFQFTPEETLALLKGGDQSTKELFTSQYPTKKLGDTDPLSESRKFPLTPFPPENKIKLLAQILSDDWIAGDDALEGFDSTKIGEYIKGVSDQLFSGLDNESVIGPLFQNIKAFDLQLSSSPPQKFSEKIDQSPTSSLYFLTRIPSQNTLSRKITAHALSGKLCSTPSGYQLHLFNSGDGIEYHAHDQEKNKVHYSITWKNIPKDAIDSSDFQEILLLNPLNTLYSSSPTGKLSCHFAKEAQYLYNTLEAYFKGFDISSESESIPITPQRSGTCSKQSWDNIVRDLITSTEIGSSEKNDSEAAKLKKILEYKLFKCRLNLLALSDSIELYSESFSKYHLFLRAIIEQGSQELSISLKKLFSLTKQLPEEDQKHLNNLALPLISSLVLLQKSFYQIQSQQPSHLDPTLLSQVIPSVKQNLTSLPLSSIDKPLPHYVSTASLEPFNQFITLLKGSSPLSQKDADLFIDQVSKLFSFSEKSALSSNRKALTFDPLLFNLSISIKDYCAHLEKKSNSPNALQSTKILIETLSKLNALIFKFFSKTPIKNSWSLTFYLLSTRLFDLLTQKKNVWVTISYDYICWVFSTQWASLITNLHEEYQSGSSLSDSTKIPIFDYKWADSNPPRPVHDSLEYSYKRLPDPTITSALEYIEEFKPLLHIKYRSADLLEERGHLKLSSPIGSVRYRQSLEDPTLIDPNSYQVLDSESKRGSPSFSFQSFMNGAKAQTHANKLVAGNNLSLGIKVDPLLLKLLQTLKHEERQALAEWNRTLSHYINSSLISEDSLSFLRVLLYGISLRTPILQFHPISTSYFSPLLNANRSTLDKFFDSLEKLLESQEQSKCALVYELLATVEDTLVLCQDSSLPKITLKLVELREKASKSQLKELDTLLDPKKGFRKEFLLYYAENQLALLKSNKKIIPDSKLFLQLLRIDDHLRHWKELDCSSYALRTQSMIQDFIKTHWKKQTAPQKEELSQEFLKFLLPNEQFRSKAIEDSLFPAFLIFDSPLARETGSSPIGYYESQQNLLVLYEPLPYGGDSLDPAFIDHHTKTFFPDLLSLPLDFNPQKSTFSLKSDTSLWLQQTKFGSKQRIQITLNLNGQNYVSDNDDRCQFLNEDRAKKGLIPLIKVDSEDVLLAYWNAITRKAQPKWILLNQILTIAPGSICSQLEGAVLGIPNLGVQSDCLNPILQRLDASSLPLFWYKKDKLVAIEIEFDHIIHWDNACFYLTTPTHHYVLDLFSRDDDLSGLLLPDIAFKLTDRATGAVYYYGRRAESDPFILGSLYSEKEGLSAILKNSSSFIKVPLIHKKPVLTTFEEQLNLIDQALRAKAYPAALNLTKKMTARADFNPTKHLQSLQKWPWEKIGKNPITYPILRYIAFSIEQHLQPSAIDKGLDELYWTLAQLASDHFPHSLPESKKNYYRNLPPLIALLPSLLPIAMESTPSENGSGKSGNTTDLFPKNKSSSNQAHLFKAEYSPLLKSSSIGCLRDFLHPLIQLPWSLVEPDQRQRLADALVKYRSLYGHHYLSMELKYKHSSSKEDTIVHTGYLSDLIHLIAENLNIDLTSSSLQLTAIPKKSLSIPPIGLERPLEEVSRSTPRRFSLNFSADSLKSALELSKDQKIESLTIDQLKNSLANLEQRILLKITPNLHKTTSNEDEDYHPLLDTLHLYPIPSFEELSHMALTNDLSQWKEFRPYLGLLSDQELIDLQHLILSHLWVSTQITHITTRKDPTGGDDSGRHYALEEPLAPFFLLYEQCAQIKLRSDQVEKLSFLLSHLQSTPSPAEKEQSWYMLQSLMGSGKSKVLTPLILLYLNKLHNCIPIYITTPALLGSAITQIATDFSQLFGLKTYQIRIHRNINLKQLRVLKQQIGEAKLGKAILLCGADDLHALHLLLPMKLLEKNPSIEVKAQYQIILEILNSFQEHAALLIDECDAILHPRQLLSYSIGLPESIEPSQIKAVSSIISRYLSRYLHELRIPLMESHSSDPAPALDKVLHDVSKDLEDEPSSNPIISSWVKLMTEAKCPRETKISAISMLLSDAPLDQQVGLLLEQALSSHKSHPLFQEYLDLLALYQYIFGVEKGLATVLQAPIFSTYGRSKTDPNLHLAIPCQNSEPCEGFQFQYYQEIMLKTSLYYLHGKLTPSDAQFLIPKTFSCLESALIRLQNQKVVDAISYYSLSPVASTKEFEEIANRINRDLHTEDVNSAQARHSRALIHFFLSYIIIPAELTHYRFQMSSTSQTLIELTKHNLAISGTAEGSSAWKERFKGKLDDKELPQIFKKALEDSKDRAYATFPISFAGKAKLSTRLEIIWKAATPMTRCLIDVGGLLRGTPNQLIAKEILKLQIPLQGEGFQGVIYYDHHSDGTSHKALMLPSGKTLALGELSIPELVALVHKELGINESVLDPEQAFPSLRLFTYYDQAHTRGSDIPQIPDAHALLLYSNHCTQTDLQQATMRMRNYLTTQKVTWLYPDSEPSAPSHSPKSLEELWQQSEKREVSQERIVRAQAHLDKINFRVTSLIKKYCNIQGTSFEMAQTLVTLLEPLLIDSTTQQVFFSTSRHKKPSYPERISQKIAHLLEIAGKIELKFRQESDDLRELAASSQKELEKDQSSLNKTQSQEDGLQIEMRMQVEVNQEMQMQQQQQVVTNSATLFNEEVSYSCRTTLDAPIKTKQEIVNFPLKDLEEAPVHIELSSFLPDGMDPEVISNGLLLSSNIWRGKADKTQTAPWEGLTLPIEIILLYTPDGARAPKAIALTALETIDNTGGKFYTQIHDIAIYNLEGEALSPRSRFLDYIRGSKTPCYIGYASYTPFEEVNLFDQRSPNPHEISILSSALVISGRVELLADNEINSKRSLHFFHWLNQMNKEKPHLREQRIELFYQCYCHRLEHYYTPRLYDRKSFFALIDQLEKRTLSKTTPSLAEKIQTLFSRVGFSKQH
jgi:hypothetical protein